MCGAVFCLSGGYVMGFGFGATVLFYALCEAVVNHKTGHDLSPTMTHGRLSVGRNSSECASHSLVSTLSAPLSLSV